MTPDLSLPIQDWLPTVWYRHPVVGHRLPAICVGRLPAAFGARRWKWWIVENGDEESALRSALARPVPGAGGAVDFKSGPDAAVSRSGRGDAVAALYAPPDDGWPWLTLVRAPAQSPDLARGRYAIDADMTETAALDRGARLASIMPEITIVSPARG